MNESAICHICRDPRGNSCKVENGFPIHLLNKKMIANKIFDCHLCGSYMISTPLLHDFIDICCGKQPEERAAVSHKLKLDTLYGRRNLIVFDSEVAELEYEKLQFLGLKQLFCDSKLPSIPEQESNILKYVYDFNVNNQDLKWAEIPIDFHTIVGSINRDRALSLMGVLRDNGLLTNVGENIICQNSQSSSNFI